MTTRLFVALMTIAMCRLGNAATITVPDDYSTIAEAIAAAADNDTISIMPGIYNEHVLNTANKRITIQGSVDEGGTLETTIDAQQQGPVFVFSLGQGDGTVIRDLVITGGLGAQLDGYNHGGGISFENYGSGTIENCIITGNAGTFGGGIKCSGYSHPTITDCTIMDNTSTYGAGISLSTDSGTIVIGCEISGNTATNSGGGVSCGNCSTIFHDCTISGNAVGGNGTGGGVDVSQGGEPTFNGCTISGNTAAQGGGICIDVGIVTVLGGTITANTASRNDCLTGGGVYIDNSISTFVFTNCTISANEPNEIDGTGEIVAASPMTAVCCLNGACMQGTEVDCMAAGGTWLGESGLCNDCPSTCDGDITGDGQLGIQDLLIMLETWGPCQ